MRYGRPTFPFPGSPAFAALSAEDQAWLTFVEPWYGAAGRAFSPRRALRHPLVAEFERNKAVHLPKFVKFYPTSPMVFDTILAHLTGVQPKGDTAEERQRHWRQVVQRLVPKSKSKAAE